MSGEQSNAMTNEPKRNATPREMKIIKAWFALQEYPTPEIKTKWAELLGGRLERSGMWDIKQVTAAYAMPICPCQFGHSDRSQFWPPAGIEKKKKTHEL